MRLLVSTHRSISSSATAKKSSVESDPPVVPRVETTAEALVAVSILADMVLPEAVMTARTQVEAETALTVKVQVQMVISEAEEEKEEEIDTERRDYT